MDITVKITVSTNDSTSDMEQARRWLAEQIRYATGLRVTGMESADGPLADFEVTAVSFIDTD